MEKNVKRENPPMSPFRLLLLSLTLLLTAAACTKARIDGPIVGNWKLVGYGYPGLTIPTSPNVGAEIMNLRHDLTYEIKFGDSVTSSGTYRIDPKTYPTHTTLYFSGHTYGWWISFSKDTLILNYLGITTGWPGLEHFVRM